MNNFQKLVFCIGIAAIVAMPLCIWKLTQYQKIYNNQIFGSPEKISAYVAFVAAYEFTQQLPSDKAGSNMIALMDNQCVLAMYTDRHTAPSRIHEECDKWLDALLSRVRKREDDFCKTHSLKPECAPEKLDALFGEIRKSYRQSREKIIAVYAKNSVSIAPD